jgi:hypothetical protein
LLPFKNKNSNYQNQTFSKDLPNIFPGLKNFCNNYNGAMIITAVQMPAVSACRSLECYLCRERGEREMLSLRSEKLVAKQIKREAMRLHEEILLLMSRGNLCLFCV